MVEIQLSTGVPGTHLFDLPRMKDWVELGAIQFEFSLQKERLNNKGVLNHQYFKSQLMRKYLATDKIPAAYLN